jgi:hypothetical protein
VSSQAPKPHSGAPKAMRFCLRAKRVFVERCGQQLKRAKIPEPVTEKASDGDPSCFPFDIFI